LGPVPNPRERGRRSGASRERSVGGGDCGVRRELGRRSRARRKTRRGGRSLVRGRDTRRRDWCAGELEGLARAACGRKTRARVGRRGHGDVVDALVPLLRCIYIYIYIYIYKYIKLRLPSTVSFITPLYPSFTASSKRFPPLYLVPLQQRFLYLTLYTLNLGRKQI
jgi:hypothetical protein